MFIACGRGFFSTNRAIQCMIAFIEWYYLASLPMHTEDTLKSTDNALRKFGNLKDVFVNISPSGLKFPKMHMLTHFIHFIRRYGTLDNLDTEYIEHAHIPLVKIPYRRSNKRDPIPQMIKYVVRQEAIEQKMAFLDAKAKKKNIVDFKRRILSSKIKKGLLSLKSVENLFKLRGIEIALRTYFHDVSYEDISPGNGKFHRVSKGKLPLLDRKIVSFSSYLHT